MSYLQALGAEMGSVDLPGVGGCAVTLASLCRQEPPEQADIAVGSLLARFENSSSLLLIALIDHDGRPVGMVTRAMMTAVSSSASRLFTGSADTLRFEALSAAVIMDEAPLTIEADATLDDLLRVIKAPVSALNGGIIVTVRGRYFGVVSVADLLAAALAAAGVREREREAAITAATAANHAKTAFLANASHEIRTPLNAIMGFAELLSTQALGPLGHPRYAEYAGDIVEGGRYLVALINDLLDLSKAEMERLELNEAWCDLSQAVRATMRLVAEQAGRGGIALREHLPPPPVLPVVLADERKLRQMLLNLLSNALKFTPPGGTVAVSCRYESEGAWLTVRDDGIGMSQSDMVQALEPWGRIDHPINREITGSGLGLPLTKRLVEMHGGRLDICSQPGTGTAMTLYFPPERLPQGQAEAAD